MGRNKIKIEKIKNEKIRIVYIVIFIHLGYLGKKAKRTIEKSYRTQFIMRCRNITFSLRQRRKHYGIYNK